MRNIWSNFLSKIINDKRPWTIFAKNLHQRSLTRFLIHFWILQLLYILLRSGQPEVFYKESMSKDFTKFTWSNRFQTLLFDKVASLKPILWHIFCLGWNTNTQCQKRGVWLIKRMPKYLRAQWSVSKTCLNFQKMTVSENFRWSIFFNFTMQNIIKNRVIYSVSKFQLKNNIKTQMEYEKWHNDTTITKTVWTFPVDYW